MSARSSRRRPQQLHDEEVVRQRARLLTRQTQRLEEATARAPRPPLAPIGVVLVLVVAVFVLISQWTLYPADIRGQHNAVRDLAVAVVLGLAGIRMATCGTNRLAVGLCLLGGLVLVLSGLAVPHVAGAVAISETVAGAVALVGALICLGSPTRRT